MTRKRRRLYMVIVGMVCLAVATGLVLNAFNQDLVFFYSPSEVAKNPPSPGRVIRIGGLVETGSLKRVGSGPGITFKVTDGKFDLNVAYSGVLPDLFREGQGVVAEGALDQSGALVASQILAKHDEKYMPPEVVAALKKSGQWRENEAASANAAAALPGGKSP
jgi:cytochrome c-type biogenesis protein CcmE